MNLNLGCGNKRIDGFVGVDKFPGDAVDVLHDLDTLPWPWETDSVDTVLMHHVLEHLGAETGIYLGIIKELYRICRAGAYVKIRVPHPRHNDFLNDPTHVRPVTAESFLLFSRQRCIENARSGHADTPLALHLGVDFEVKRAGLVLERDWKDHPHIDRAIATYNNVIKEISIELEVVK